MSNVVIVGSSNTDITGYAPHLPEPGETAIGSKIQVSPGGKGLNQMVAAHRSGSSVTFVSRIGKDVFGEVLHNFLISESVDQSYIISDDEKPTGCALIEIDEKDAQNRILVIPGANDNIKSSDVDAASEKISECDIVLAQLEIDLITVKHAKDIAKRYDKIFILNPAPYKPLNDEMLKDTDWFTPNETEASYFTGMEVNDLESARIAADILLDKGIKNVVITLGKNGVFWTDGKASKHIPAVKVKAVDTTGAGDTFNGALATALAQKFDPEKALMFANAAAALSVSRTGAANSCPFEKEIIDSLEK